MNATGDIQSAGGFAVELHVDNQVVGRFDVLECRQQGAAVGIGVDHFDTAHHFGVEVAALHVGGTFVHFHLDDLANQRFVVDHHYSYAVHFSMIGIQ